jgi:O-antigen ligase
MSQSKKKKAAADSKTVPRGLWGAPLHEWLIAAGLAILIFWRPWQDGIVNPDSNSTFLMGAAILFGIWAFRSVMKNDVTMAAIPTALLAAFLLVAWLTRFAALEFHTSNQTFLVWCGYAMVFVLAASLRSGTAIGFVIGAVVITSASEAVYSLIHLKYSLPETRILVKNNPGLAEQLFGYELNAALVHRLENNRAFGTLLFANALATWLVAAIPLAVFGAVHAMKRLAAKEHVAADPILRGVLIGAFAGLVSAPILSAGQSVSATVGEIFDNPALIVPVAGLYPLPLTALFMLIAQLLAVAAGAGIYSVLRLLMPERDDGADSRALIAGVLTAGALCVSIAPAYAFFHHFAYAQPVTMDGAFRMDRAPLVEPILPFVLCVFVVPVACAGGAIAAMRKGLATGVASIAAAVFLFALLAQAFSLWSTYSRGGMLALAIGIGAAAFLLRAKVGKGKVSKPVRAAAIVAIIAAAAIGATHVGAAFAQEGPKPNPLVDEISAEGNNMTVGDLLNPTTVSLRFSYWGGAFKMAAGHFLTGVGQGNFGLAYPQYQPVGGGDSKQAHNDFLQVTCETGILGGALFAGFWGWILIAGGREIIRRRGQSGVWLCAALYASVAGFLVHAFVDFPFVNPSLATLVFLCAGLLCASFRLGTDAKPATVLPPQVLGVAALIFTCVVVFGLVRVKHIDAAVGNKQLRNDRLSIAAQIIRGIEVPPNRPPSVADRSLAKLIEDPEMRRAFGTHFYQARPNDQNYTALPPGSAIPPHALLMISKMELLQAKALEASVNWTTRLAEVDAKYPHNPEFAMHISMWYDMLWRTGGTAAEGLEYIKQAVVWAERAVERNRYSVGVNDWLARMHWRVALSESAPDVKVAGFERSLAVIDRSLELSPNKPEIWDRHADLYQWAGDWMTRLGRDSLAVAWQETSRVSRAKATELRAAWAERAEEWERDNL